MRLPVGTLVPVTLQELAGIVASVVPRESLSTQEVVTLLTFEMMIVVPVPEWTRLGLAVSVPVGVPEQLPPPAVAVLVQEPPAPVHVSVYVPAVLMPATEPLVAFPVEKPPPVQEVALVEDHVRVVGSVVAGEAVSEQVGGGVKAGETVTAVHALEQLLASFDSVMTPVLAADALSAQVRM